MLEANLPNGRFYSTLAYDPLIFNRGTEDITIHDGGVFQHTCKENIKQLAKNLNRVGDWGKELVDIPDPFPILGPPTKATL